ncbi:MAG: hypothetical protein V1912_05685 [bacterium]
MKGERPLRYVDADDPELEDFPALAGAIAEGRRTPLVLVGDEVKAPAAISVYWAEDQLAALGVAPFADDGGGEA